MRRHREQQLVEAVIQHIVQMLIGISLLMYVNRTFNKAGTDPVRTQQKSGTWIHVIISLLPLREEEKQIVNTFLQIF